MAPLTPAEEKFKDDYRALLRSIKNMQLDLSAAPKEVQDAALALHQYALALWNKEHGEEQIK